ncbi:DNA-binding transcriptional regulator, PadR family [Pedococcus dokdonensis]|uniref:DNA-binding transcriptional regulator, PadR family n=1 Tax=Pedococcus dokdonensis TaxID=443156 RepID=A0A1H0TG27_9MICO|nr:PadR family transcriptional regulator [Pedococcus dokdonensis]SDP52949.1 DNA-binding transcriptional regulator, PadR family [Pedococcus dokdonensis]
MSRRSELLEFAVLGLLHESPMHGYELRKRLNAALGVFRALSYGTLYPCLRGLLESGLISEASTAQPAATAGSRRARIVYELTADGKEQFQELLKEAGPTAWEDDTFDVHLAFFARTEAEVRLRILEGRRSRLEERLDTIRASSAKNRERFDTYTAALERHGLDSAEREVRWLNELITAERNIPSATPSTTTSTPTPNK